jgi:hypothetical protein
MTRRHLAAIKERYMRLRLVLLVLAAAGSLAAGGEAQAQFRFSIGGSGFSVGNMPYGYGGYGYGYNPYYYNPPAGRQNYYDYDDTPQQTYTPAPPYSGPGVTVRNPAGSKVKLAYLLDDSEDQEISAGETKKLAAKGSYTISFDRGGNYGSARYTITEGLYEFTMTARGWELYRQKDMPAEKQVDPKAKVNPLPEGPKDVPKVEEPKPRDADEEKPKET